MKFIQAPLHWHKSQRVYFRERLCFPRELERERRDTIIFCTVSHRQCCMLALLAVLMWLQLNGGLTRAKLPLHCAYSYRHCVHTDRLLP